MNALRRLWCRWRGHLWSRAKYEHLGGGVYATAGGMKTCRRCGETRPVKRRK